MQPAAITTLLELDRAFDASADHAVVVFKHSPRCAVSVSAWSEYRSFVDRQPSAGPLYTTVDVLAARDVADEIARRTGVRHESPQIVVLRDGKVVWSGSHWEASSDGLEKALAEPGGR